MVKLPSTFGILEAARSGLNASQLGLSVTSQNIANVNTDGYTRQVINTSSMAPNSGADRYLQSSLKVGQGVSIDGVYQVRDDFLDIRYRYQNSQYQMWNGEQDQLTSIEDYFTEISDSTTTTNQLTGLSGQLDSLITALQNCQKSPDDTNLPANIQTDVDMLTQSIKQDASELKSTMSRESSELGIIVNGGAGNTANGNYAGGINGMVQSLQGLNQQIASYEISGQKANDLRDQRNLLLDKLSDNLDIDTTELSNGMVTVKLRNDNHYLIDGQNNAQTLSIGTDSTSNATVLKWSDGSTANIQGGLVKSYLNVMNGDGSGDDNAATGKCGNLGIPYLEEKLNNFAIGVYKVINNFNGVDVDSSNMASGAKFLTYDGDGTGVSDPAQNGAAKAAADPLYVASSIGLSDAWSTDPDYFANSYTGSDKGDYYSAYVNAIQTTDSTVPTTTDGSSSYSGSLRDFADSFTQDISSSINVISEKSDWYKTNTDNIDQQRQSISSVSTNDEGVNIIKYQQAYNANSRVITAIDEMLDKLINSTGTTT